jgi:hypothetical protein
MEIKVEKVDETTFQVTVTGRATTTHTVTLAAAYCDKLTGGKLPPEGLIRRSFEFLLEREPNTSILRRFDLPLIQTYFPEYEQTIRGMTG